MTGAVVPAQLGLVVLESPDENKRELAVAHRSGRLLPVVAPTRQHCYHVLVAAPMNYLQKAREIGCRAVLAACCPRQISPSPATVAVAWESRRLLHL